MLKTITASEFETIIGLGAEKWLDNEIDVMNSLDVSEYTLSGSMDRQIRSIIRRNSRKERWAPVFHYAKIAGIILVSVISILFAAAMMIQPVRAAFFNAIVQWYDNYVAIRFVSEEDVPTKIEEVKYPSYLPEGWQIELDYQGKVTVESTLFNPSDGAVIYYEQTVHSSRNEIWFDNTDAVVTEVYLNGQQPAHLFSYEDGSFALSWNDVYDFSLISDQCSLDLLLKIAESIQ